MIRQTIFPLALVVTALLLSGCATTRTVADEPTPKEEGEPAADTPEVPMETAAEAPPPDAPEAPPAAPEPTPPPPSGFIPSGKPVIVARVDRVQFPAWVNRAGIRAGIKAGWAIYTGDRILTGTDGRVELNIAGEGQFKVGGDADVQITEAYEFTGGVEPSLLSIRRGAFQFSAPMVKSGTTGALIQVGGAIDVNVMSGQLVGRVDSEEALIALVDATVRVSGPKLNPGTMREPRTFLRVPQKGRAQAVTAASGERMARWLAQAGIVSGRPTLSAEGVWDVSLNSGYSLRELETMACRVQRRGYPSEIYPVKEPGKLTWYRVVVRRFATKGDAVNFMSTAKSLGSKEPWVLVPQS